MKSVQWIKTLTAVLVLVISNQSHADDLLQIFNLTANNDAQVREARERFEASHTLIDQGRSQLLPSVSLQGSTARNANAPADFYSYGAGFNSHGWRLNLNQNLLNMEAWYAFKSAKISDLAGATNLAIACTSSNPLGQS